MKMIFLNGASSAGKSSIAKALQNTLEQWYLHIGIDTFIAMMPDKANQLGAMSQTADGFYWQPQRLADNTQFRIAAGDYGKQVNEVYRTTVKHLIDNELKVIVDDAINGQQEWKIWQSLLNRADYVMVGVLCDDKDLIHREKMRGDRKIGSAIEQSARVHQGMVYDLTVNTSSHSARECAEMIKAYMTTTSVIEK